MLSFDESVKQVFDFVEAVFISVFRGGGYAKAKYFKNRFY